MARRSRALAFKQKGQPMPENQATLANRKEAPAIYPVNYSSHAIEQLKKDAAMTKHAGYHESAAVFDAIADALHNSVKFLLPNRAELLDRESVGQAHHDLIKLPYPVIALEAPWYNATGTVLPGEGVSTRRIAL